MDPFALRWSWMNVLTKKRWEVLAERFGTFEKALQNTTFELLRELGFRDESALIAMNRMEEFEPAAYEKELKKRDLQFLTMNDEAYPDLLRQLPDAPVFLYARGDIALMSQSCIAVVGTREMSDYGKRVAEHFVAPLVKAGLVTVSGLAAGIDSEVARETMRAGGKTIAVLGHGMGMMYPKANERLAADIVKNGGLILSEFPLDIRPDKFTFPARNRIIAGLAHGTVVLEAAVGSGSLITADLALDYNRDVFAVPGQIFDAHYAGCHQIIAKGTAKLVTKPEDVLLELGIAPDAAPTQESLFVADSPEEETVWKALTTMPLALDDLVVKAKLDAAVVNATLTMLELRGSAKNIGSGKWVKV